jgi:hypothetical protein
MIRAGFDLSLRLVSVFRDMCRPAALKAEALNSMRERSLKETDRVKIEAKLTGLVYSLNLVMVFLPIRHACFFLAHPELTLTYQDVLDLNSPKLQNISQQFLACGLDYELRTPDPRFLRKTYRQLNPAGQDLLHFWTWMFLSFNRVAVTKRQAILEGLDMKSTTQLLLPQGTV